MGKQKKTVNITIDGNFLEVGSELTILQAAERNDIYIPTLCAHDGLTPFGGCRICIVEVEGMRGFPTACTTPVEEGMVIKTRTPQIQDLRREILQLILSEHTSSCLICDERNECRESMSTIRKAGVTTGCRYCPSDGQCELQDVVEYVGLEEINYPIYYRGLRVEKEDPFYDRDYNLCILCGRCIRVCQEIRNASTLAFKQRGPHTVIGPAFDRTHFDADCEFCGACVSVCPTGALSEKARKWDGKADRQEVTTCALCGVGCQMSLLVKGGKIIGSLPVEDPLVNNGQLCVKGRFCITELVNNHQRLKKPYVTRYSNKLEIPWEKAVELAAEKLSDCPPEQFGLLISLNCSNEDLYIAQKFAWVAMGSHNIDTTARLFYESAFNAYLNLMKMGVPLSDLQRASTVLCVGLDTKYGRSVVGVELRKAIKNGAKVITINPRRHSLSLIADKWLQPAPGEEVDLLHFLVKLTEDKTITSGRLSKGGAESPGGEPSAVAEMLREASPPMILVGSEFLQYDKSAQILEMIGELARNIGAGVLALPAQNNLFGSVLMGAYPELLPGGFPSTNEKRVADLGGKWGADVPYFSPQWNSEMLLSGGNMKVLYLIGEVPFSYKPPSDFLIFQNIYPPAPLAKPDLVFPSASFAEIDGTFINGEGRIQRVRKAVDPPGEALPDWEILCRIAQKMGVGGFDFSDVREVHEEISCLVKGFGDIDNAERKAGPLAFEGELAVSKIRLSRKKTDDKFPFTLNISIDEHTYLGFPLSNWVEGARKLFPVETVDINPEDARKAGILQGDEVIVTSADFEKVWPARIVSDQPKGTLQVTLPHGEAVAHSRCTASIRKRNV